MRDEEILKQVFTVIANLKGLPKPVHINISRIGKEIGMLALLEKHLDKLPKTNDYIQRNIETTEEFQIRRVKWAADTLKNEKAFQLGKLFV
ncbi:hypothetical protein KHA80_09235 [Anaerobacillus sp. HL2]|nr:hypothetical protein KHA80_09235 [Anaerobacillus sp. HL2]